MEKYLQMAYLSAKEGMQNNEGGPFGAVIVKNGEVLAVAHNEVLKRNDPTAHAEILAIRKACEKLGHFELKGCELYTTGEPCPMCFSAIHWARLDKVIFCNTKEEAAKIGFDDSFITEIIQQKVTSPIIFTQHKTTQCHQLLRFWEEKTDKTPY